MVWLWCRLKKTAEKPWTQHSCSTCHEKAAGNDTAPATHGSSVVGSIFRRGSRKGRITFFMRYCVKARYRRPQREVELTDLLICRVLLQGCLLQSLDVLRNLPELFQKTPSSAYHCAHIVSSHGYPVLDLFWVSPGLRNTQCYFWLK